MFENIIGHKSITEQMKREIENNTFPASLMITGPLYSGKQTIALEAARALTCENSAEWNCQCQSCSMHRVFSNPSVLLMGWDLFMPEISSVLNLLERKKESVSCILFIRGVRKLLARFNPVITEENDSRYKRISARVSTIEELLADFDEAISGNGNIDIDKAGRIVEQCREVIKDYSYNGISVDQVRKAGYWLRFSGYGKRKIIIIENAENMNESARNSFLKILEEPPENSCIMFLTGKPGEIIPTIKSRLRKYDLRERSLTENRQVIEKIFRDDGSLFTTLKDYLNSSAPESEMIRKAARQFMVDLFDSRKNTEGLPAEIRAALFGQNSLYFTDFLSEILKLSQELINSPEFIDSSPENLFILKKISRLVNDSYRGFEVLNINPELLAESIFLELGKSL